MPIGISTGRPIGQPADEATEFLHGSDNLKRYNKSKPPRGYPGWPYNRFASSDLAMKTLQGQLDGIAKECRMPEPEPNHWSVADDNMSGLDSSSHENDSSASELSDLSSE